MAQGISILFITLVFQISAQMNKPLVPLLSEYLGLSGVTIGLVIAIQAFLPFFLAIPVGRMVDTSGCRRVLRWGSYLTIGTGVLYFCSNGVVLLTLAQILSGVGQLLIWLSVQTAATQLKTSVSARDSYIGFFGSFSAVGQFLAPIMGGVAADIWGYRIALLMLSGLGIFLLLGTALVPETAPDRPSSLRRSTIQSYREGGSILMNNRGVQLTVLAGCIPVFVTQIRSSFLPLYLHDLSFSNTSIGMIVGLGSLAAIFCRAMMGPMIVWLGRRRVLYMSLFTSFLPIAAVPLFHGFWPLACLSALSGWGGGINEPMTMSLLAAYTTKFQRGVAMGLRLTGNRASQFLAPLFFTVFYRYHGLAASFVDFGILLTFWCVGCISFISYYGLGSGLGVEEKEDC